MQLGLVAHVTYVAQLAHVAWPNTRKRSLLSGRFFTVQPMNVASTCSFLRLVALLKKLRVISK